MNTLKFIPHCFIVFILFTFSLAGSNLYSQGNFCKLVFCNCCPEKQSYIVLDSAENVVGSFELDPYGCTTNIGGSAWPPGSTYHVRNISCPFGERVIDVYFTVCVCSYLEIDTIKLPCCPVIDDGKPGKNLNDIKDFKLNQNFPNPFNPSTKIAFELPKSSSVTLTIYDASGRVVAEPIAGNTLEAGYHEYNWNTSGTELASGVYFYKLKAGNFTDEKKMVLIK